MNIEEIMKPYYVKKEEFDKKYIQEKNSLKLEHKNQVLEQIKSNDIKSIVEVL